MKKPLTTFLIVISITFLYIGILAGLGSIGAGHNKVPQNMATSSPVTPVATTATASVTEKIPVTLSSDTSQTYKIAIASSNGTYQVVSSEAALSAAEYKVLNVNNDNLIIVKDGSIIYVKYGLVNLATKAVTQTTYFSVNGNTDYTNGSCGADAAFINTSGSSYEMALSNARGLVSQNDVTLVPLADVKSPSYYYVDSYGEIDHAISTDITAAGSYIYSGPFDKAPSYLSQGVDYYSYDGIYFYTSLQSLINGLRNDTTKDAVNADKPYYNYYEYLPLRSNTAYSAQDLNGYLNHILKQRGDTGSVLYNTGADFINAQTTNHVNALMELSWAIHESGYGMSSIAIDKNNLFGLNAIDSNPYGNSDSFNSVADCISYHSGHYVSGEYLDNRFFDYSGTSVGNKGVGLNVFYASDPYWGEKIAAGYYQIDKYLGFSDYHHYTIGITAKMTPVYSDAAMTCLVYDEQSNSDGISYGMPVIVSGQENGYYKVLTNNGSYGYVEKADLYLN